MTTDLGSCSTCGASRPAGTAFCGQCGHPFDPAMRAADRLPLKVAVGRVLGAAAGAAIWWFVVVPKVINDLLPFAVTGSLLIYAGYLVGQEVVRRAVVRR